MRYLACISYGKLEKCCVSYDKNQISQSIFFVPHRSEGHTFRCVKNKTNVAVLYDFSLSPCLQWSPMVCRHSHKSIARGPYELLLWWWRIDLSSYGNVLCDRETGHIFKYHEHCMISVNTESITGFEFPMSCGENEMLYYCISVSVY